MMHYGTAAEAEAALGRSMTWAETLWFRYSAAMPELWLMWHVSLVYLVAYALAPLPAMIIQQIAPGYALRYKLQPGVPQPSPVSTYLRYMRESYRITLARLGSFTSHLHRRIQVVWGPDGAPFAVGMGDGDAPRGVLVGGRLPVVLAPPLPAHQVGLREDPPCPPPEDGAIRVRRVLCSRHRAHLVRHHNLCWPNDRAMPHHDALALVRHPHNGSLRRTLGLSLPVRPASFIPFFGGAEFHDYHHYARGKTQSNFSSVFTYCDYIYGTNKGYLHHKESLEKLKTKQAEHNMKGNSGKED